jgi:hypothetical protein
MVATTLRTHLKPLARSGQAFCAGQHGITLLSESILETFPRPFVPTFTLGIAGKPS